MRITKAIVVLLLTTVSVFPSNPDSLKRSLSASAPDSLKMKTYGTLSGIYQGSQPDSCIKYALLGLNYCDNNTWCPAMYRNIGISLRVKGMYDSAISVLKHGLEITGTIKVTNEKKNKQYATLYNELGTCYNIRGNKVNAIESYLKSIEHYKKSNVTAGETYPLTNLAILYASQNDYDKALEYFKEIKDIHKKIGDNTSLFNDNVNIGAVYDRKRDFSSSLKYYTEALSIVNENIPSSAKAMLYNNIAGAYNMKKDNVHALASLETALKLWQLSGDKEGECYTLNNMASSYLSAGNKDKSYETGQKALAIAREINSREDINNSLRFLVQVCEAKMDFKNALAYQKEYTGLKEKDLAENNSKAVAEMKTKFDSDKKEQENVFLQKENSLSAKTIQQQKLITTVIIIALAVAVALIFLVFRGFKKQREANHIIREQKKEVEIQKHLVEEKQKEVMDSIHYAKRIQSALLAHKDYLAEHLPHSFTFFKPKDIVSGDFYWATEVQGNELDILTGAKTLSELPTPPSQLFYLAICDSTGHGVPGAFMSLLNIGFLSEAINEKKIHKPNEVLDYVRERLVGSISRENQKDGFDGILICIEKKNGYNHISYAAANNAPVLISNGTIIELPKDKMPVGKGERPQPFTLFDLRYEPGDWLYLYTDGYADQFGGDKGKKFKYKPLNELLLEVAGLHPQEQSEKLSQRFEHWKGNLEQVDDVLIAGLKL